MIIIFDSNIYELADCQINDEMEVTRHFNYLDKIISFVKSNKLCHTILCYSEEYNAIANFLDHPWNQYHQQTKALTCYNILPIVYRNLFELFNYENISRSNPFSPAIPLFDIKYCSKNSELCYNEFLKHISEIKENKALEYHVFMGTANYNLSTPLHFELNGIQFDIEPIMNIEDEDVINFSNGYRNLLMANGCIQPSLDNPLPNKDWCKNYETIQKNLVENGHDKIEIYRQIVKEVALRNGYVRDDAVSAYNSSSDHIRDIYNSQTNPIVYISADIEHGGVEVCNQNGQHQGEYTYIGTKRTPSDKTKRHDILIPGVKKRIHRK